MHIFLHTLTWKIYACAYSTQLNIGPIVYYSWALPIIVSIECMVILRWYFRTKYLHSSVPKKELDRDGDDRDDRDEDGDEGGGPDIEIVIEIEVESRIEKEKELEMETEMEWRRWRGEVEEEGKRKRNLFFLTIQWSHVFVACNHKDFGTSRHPDSFFSLHRI